MCVREKRDGKERYNICTITLSQLDLCLCLRMFLSLDWMFHYWKDRSHCPPRIGTATGFKEFFLRPSSLWWTSISMTGKKIGPVWAPLQIIWPESNIADVRFLIKESLAELPLQTFRHGKMFNNIMYCAFLQPKCSCKHKKKIFWPIPVLAQCTLFPTSWVNGRHL